MVVRASSGEARQVLLVVEARFPPITEQMLPILQAEKLFSPGWATGLMMNLASALQVVVDRGQHDAVELHPSAH
jgi:hypothetical protein